MTVIAFLFYSLIAKLNLGDMNSINSSEIVGVCQQEYGMTNSSSLTPCIGTPSVSSCIVMIVYNPMCKEATLAHLDGATATEASVHKIFEKISSRPGVLQVSFAGGWDNGPHRLNQFIQDLIGRLKDTYGYKANCQYLFKYVVKSGEFLGNGSFSYVGIDTRNGKVTVKRNNEQCPEFSKKVEAKPINLAPNSELKLTEDTRGAIDYDRLDLEPSVKKYYLDFASSLAPWP